MRNLSRPFPLLILGLALVAAPALVAAKRASSVVCESIDGRVTECDVGWKSAVMDRQLSRAACIRHETWGIDRGHSFARGGIAAPVAIGPTDDAEMGSKFGDVVECPLVEGVATG